MSDIITITKSQLKHSPLFQMTRARWWKFWNPMWRAYITGQFKVLKPGKFHQFRWYE